MNTTPDDFINVWLIAIYWILCGTTILGALYIALDQYYYRLAMKEREERNMSRIFDLTKRLD